MRGGNLAAIASAFGEHSYVDQQRASPRPHSDDRTDDSKDVTMTSDLEDECHDERGGGAGEAERGRGRGRGRPRRRIIEPKRYACPSGAADRLIQGFQPDFLCNCYN